MFDEIGVFAFDDGDDLLRGATVIDGIVQVVARPGRRQVQMQCGVDDELLRTLMFEIKHAVPAAGTHAGENDPIHGFLSACAARMPLPGNFAGLCRNRLHVSRGFHCRTPPNTVERRLALRVVPPGIADRNRGT